MKAISKARSINVKHSTVLLSFEFTYRTVQYLFCQQTTAMLRDHIVVTTVTSRLCH